MGELVGENRKRCKKPPVCSTKIFREADHSDQLLSWRARRWQRTRLTLTTFRYSLLCKYVLERVFLIVVVFISQSRRDKEVSPPETPAAAPNKPKGITHRGSTACAQDKRSKDYSSTESRQSAQMRSNGPVVRLAPLPDIASLAPTNTGLTITPIYNTSMSGASTVNGSSSTGSFATPGVNAASQSMNNSVNAWASAYLAGMSNMMSANEVMVNGMDSSTSYGIHRGRSRFAEPPAFFSSNVRSNSSGSRDTPKTALTISPKAAPPPPRVTIQSVVHQQQSRSRYEYRDGSSSSYAPPIAPDVTMEELPFYPVLDCLMKPQTLGKFGKAGVIRIPT